MNIINYILIDTENIGSYNALEDLINYELKDNGFHLVLFKNKNSKPIKSDFWDLLFNKSNSFKSMPIVGVGNQNMDIQIASYAGYLIATNHYENEQNSCSKKKAIIYLYSNDNHLINCSKFLNEITKDFEIKHLKESSTIKSSKSKKSNKSNKLTISSKKLVLTEELMIELTKLTPSIDVVINEVNKNKTLVNLHNELAKRFPNGKQIYKLIKKHVKYS